jgi:conjugative transfer region lipoprotein (TIGR03751 family)
MFEAQPINSHSSTTFIATRKTQCPVVSMLLACLILLNGCSTMGGKDTILPQEGASMKEVYDAHFKQSSQRHHNSRAQIGSAGAGYGEGNLAGYTREAGTEIQALFPRLPNPPLVMYIFPHLTGTGQPVPGYATSFPMYDKTEYALPGETEGRQ